MQYLPKHTTPQHVAIIMDGNGRWASEQDSPRLAGHRQGVQALETIVRAAPRYGLTHLTVFAFSTLNWKRDPYEVKALMRLFEEQLEVLSPQLLDESIKLLCIGNREDGRVPSSLRAKMSEVEHATNRGKRLTLVLAINYSAEDELLRATKKAFANQSVAVTEHLDTAEVPNPDIVIRTGCKAGCWYDSGFLSLQSAHALKVPLETYWPDFSADDLSAVIDQWQQADKLHGGQRRQVG
jgi:undecaprenyl diphosphate synthase